MTAPRRTSKVATGTCRVCGDLFDRRRYDAQTGHVVGIDRHRRLCPRHRWARGGDGSVLVDRLTPYQDDVACQLFVASFPGGATLDSIAEAIGVSRERVRQIEGDAKAKLSALGLSAFGVNALDPDERRDGRARHDDAELGDDDAEQGEEEGAP